jgi:hypothetical protein
MRAAQGVSPTRTGEKNNEGGSAADSGSQGVLTIRDKLDTTSLFDVSCDSNGTPKGSHNIGEGEGETYRSTLKKSHRNTYGGAMVANQAPAPGLMLSQRVNSKTARE